MKRLAVAALIMAMAGCESAPIPIPLPSLPPPAPIAGYDCAAPPALAGVVQVHDAIVGRYIVVFHRTRTAQVDARAVQVAAQALASRYSLREVKAFSSALSGFVATADAVTALRLAADPQVAYVQQEGSKSTRHEQSQAFLWNSQARQSALVPPWNLDRVDQRALPLDGIYEPGSNGAGVHAAIIDTGIDAGHPDFTGRLGDCFSAQAGGCADQHDHGTHVAGTVGGRTWGVANMVTLHAVRVLNAQGSGSDSDVIRGIDWVTQQKQAHPEQGWVANMSLGGSAAPALDQAVCNSIAAGVVYVVAAGNESTDACGSSPAHVVQAITLGASDRSDRGASFSNTGQCVDIIGPGVDVESARRGGGSVVFSGTSMASPHGAGTVALYLQRNPGATPAQAAAGILAAATPDKLSGIGGTPNRLLYVRPQ